MRVLLVNMPWAPVDVPSLALGILKRGAERKVPGAQVEVRHANLDYTDWITKRREFSLRDYEFYAQSSYFLGCGDWVFSSALYDDPHWRVAEFEQALGHRIPPQELKMSLDLHELAPQFIAELVEQVAATGVDVVGFTSTFQQNTAALAAARQLKRLAPHVRTVFGGANCDGEQGAALQRNFDCVDFVVRGEGEAAFPALLAALHDGGSFAAVPGLCWRDQDDVPVANAMTTTPLPPAEIAKPDYDGYFERFAASSAGGWVEPKLVLEGSRGCWWGEKHHCTFCGLNGSMMQFRSKSPASFLAEIIELTGRHRVLDIFVVDNILDMGYLTSLLPDLVEAGYDLRMHYEIKSNLRLHQLRTLSEAGLIYVQPGVESLNSQVLSLMDKGVSGCQNVRMLRDAESVGLTVTWNYLYGFPGEADGHYEPILNQLSALHHLAPPDSSGRIEIERFSPYFTNPALGFADLRPAEQYRTTYDLPDAELFDLAYLFAAERQGIADGTARRLEAAVSQWGQEYPRSRLTHCDLGDQIVLVNSRPAFEWTVLRLTDPAELAAFRLLDQPHALPALAKKLGADLDEVTGLVARWHALGLLFTDNGQYVQVAPVAANQELLHLADLSAPALEGS